MKLNITEVYRNKILEVLQDDPKGMTFGDLIRTLKVRKQFLFTTLGTLYEDHTLEAYRLNGINYIRKRPKLKDITHKN